MNTGGDGLSTAGPDNAYYVKPDALTDLWQRKCRRSVAGDDKKLDPKRCEEL